MFRFLTLAAVCCAIFGAQMSPIPSPPRTSALVPGKAIVLGRVLETGSTVGVSGAVVTLTGLPLGTSGTVFSDGTPGGARRVVADGQGRFMFRDLPAGAYSLGSSAPGYVDGLYGRSRTIQVQRVLDVTRRLELNDSDRPANVTIEMSKLGGFGGLVRDEFGDPMVGVPVTVFSRVADWGGAIVQESTTVRTDDRGAYHVDLIPGTYIVGVVAPTTTISTSAADAFTQAQAAGQEALTQYMNSVMRPGGILPRGNGQRVGDFIVNQWSMNVAAVPPSVSLNGRPALYPTTFFPDSLTLSGAGVVAIGSGEEKSGVNLDLRPVPIRRVSGRVNGPDGPAANMTVRLVPPDPAAERTSPATLVNVPLALTDGHGDFTFIGVVPGPYVLRVIRTPNAATDPVLWAADAINVADTDVSGLQVALQGGARISGHLEFDASGVPPTLTSWRSATIAARAVPGSAGAFQTTQLIDRFDETGRFATRAYIPGQYEMTVAGFSSPWIVKSVMVGDKNVLDMPFDLPTTDITNMIVTITDKVSTLAGTARDASGQPASTSSVAVFPASRTLWRLPGMGSRRVQVDLPTRDGRFSFRGLPSGEYYLVAVDGATLDFSDPAVLSMLIPSATRITLHDGESATQDLSVKIVKEP